MREKTNEKKWESECEVGVRQRGRPYVVGECGLSRDWFVDKDGSAIPKEL
jgi:hypothetical protein